MFIHLTVNVFVLPALRQACSRHWGDSLFHILLEKGLPKTAEGRDGGAWEPRGRGLPPSGISAAELLERGTREKTGASVCKDRLELAAEGM